MMLAGGVVDPVTSDILEVGVKVLGDEVEPFSMSSTFLFSFFFIEASLQFYFVLRVLKFGFILKVLAFGFIPLKCFKMMGGTICRACRYLFFLIRVAFLAFVSLVTLNVSVNISSSSLSSD